MDVARRWSQFGSVVVVPPPQSDVPSTSRRSRWVWRRRQVDQPVETEQTVGTVRRVDTVVPSVAAVVPMICDRAADDEFVPSVSPPVRVGSAGVSDQHGASSPMGPHIDALCQTFSEDDWLGEELEEDVPVHRVCVVTRRGTSDEHRDIDDDMEEQGEADGGPPRSVDTDATVLQLQAHMAEMARAMATMTAQLTALGVAPQVMEVGTPTTSRDEPVVPPVVVPDPVRVERVQRTVPTVLPAVTFSTPAQTQSVQMSPGQIQDMITQKVEQAISSRNIKTFQKLLTKVTSLQDSIPSAVPPKVESQPLRRPQRQEFSGAPPPPRKADVHSTFEVQDKGKRPMRPPPPPRPQFPPRPQLPPQAPAQSSGQFQSRPPVQQSRPPYRTPEKHQYLQERLNKEYPFKRESSEQCGSQHGSQSSDSGEPLSSGEEWQLALSHKTRVPTEHISSSSCIRKMYEREKLVVTSEGKTGSLPALTLKDFVLPPIDDELMEEDDSGYFWSLFVPSSSRSRTRSFHVLSISDDDIISLHEEEFECDEPVFTIPEGGCYMDSGDESEGTPQPLLVEATQAMTLEPNESPDEFDSVQEIQLRSGKGPSQVCIEADVSAADHVRSPFQFAVGHDVPPSRGRGWRGRGRSKDSDYPARNIYSRVPPPNLHSFPLTVESDSDDEMIDIVHRPAPLQSLSFADYSAFPTVNRHLIPEGGLVIDGGSDDDADVGRQDTSRQSFPHPRYGMRVEGSSQQPSPVPPTTSVRGPLYSDSPSVHELHTLYVPPQPGWHASLFHSVGVPQSTDTPGFVESIVDDEITFAPRLSSPFVDSCVERGLVPTTWTDGQARQQARVWRTDLPQTTRGIGWAHQVVVEVALLFIHCCEYGQVNIELFSFAVANMVRRMLNPFLSLTLCLAVANMGCPHSPLRIWSGECWSFSFFCPAVANMVKQTLDFWEGSLFAVANMVRWIMSHSHSPLRIWSGECRISLFWLGARQGFWEAYFTTSSFPLFLFPVWGLLSFLVTLCLAVANMVRRTLGRPHSLLRIWSSECWTFLLFCPTVANMVRWTLDFGWALYSLLRIWSGEYRATLLFCSLLTVSIWSGE
ncbi:hypothetical protein M5K25_021988 [Dendrobium thyrsiflorum]|uniref:Uncharacterized protein n=1 Tax=Dendrobium thyrsiflorum TaxID=117978 RepID=A0ABD0UAY6_DENTH